LKTFSLKIKDNFKERKNYRTITEMNTLPEITFTQAFCCYCKKFGHNFRESDLDENSAVLCPVLLNTKCKRCNQLGHTTTRCKNTYHDEEECSYCHIIGHIKANCPILGSKTCTFCQGVGHVRNRCFLLMYKNQGIPSS
jgi:hypothetical protein